MHLQIQRASPDQAETLTQIGQAAKAYWGYPRRWMEQWKHELTFSSDYFEENESWVAEMEQGPVGFYTLLEREGNAWLGNLWVSPEFIGQGVGKRLFLHAQELSRQRGFVILRLEADPNAAGFYEKMGMKKIGERKSEIEGQPRILPIMEIRL